MPRPTCGRARFLRPFAFNPNTITMTTGTTHTVFYGYQNTSTVVLAVDFGYTAPNFQIRAGLVNTASTWTNSSWFTITKASHSIELDWRAAVSGTLTLWIDGVQKANLTAVNNNTRRVDMVRLGPVAGITNGTRGVEYFDAFVSHRTSFIGGMNHSQGRVLAMRIALAPATPHPIPSLSATPSPTLSATPTPTLSATPTMGRRAVVHQMAKLNPGLASLPRLVAAPSALASNGGLVTTVITYTQDALYRLTEADYSDGQYFRYTYDADGNRLLQYKTGGQATAYSYDNANRLTQVGGTAYQWDANGNLVNDGVSAYGYDAANRLVSVVQGTNVYSYTYNGTGDRLSQTANGVATYYTLDLNAGLTQVLADGTNTFLYGTARLGEQQPGGFVYHLGDALGSVRQLVSTDGNVTLAQSYEPYGSVLSSVGAGKTMFQFTGEQLDKTGLTYLRARYYTGSGNFLTADTATPDPNEPQGLNRYAYVKDNVVNRTDPTGRKPCDDIINGKCIVWPKEPWTKYRGDRPYSAGYDPNSDSIPDWGRDYLSEPWREIRSGRVWNWICSSGGWWGSGCPNAKQLTRWILPREVGFLYNDAVVAAAVNQNGNWKIDAGKQVVVGYMKDLFGNGNIAPQDLAKFTSFFNPIYGSGGAFTASDWGALMTAPPSSPDYAGEVDKYWELGPYLQDGHRVDRFWTNVETIQCTACTIAFQIDIAPLGQLQTLGSTVSFGYLAPKSGNATCRQKL